MITAVDTSVLLDVFGADRRFGEASREALRRCLAEGSLIACEVVWAEVAAAFPSPDAAAASMSALRVRFSAIDADIALSAGRAWSAYREAGGRRQRVIADFMIGAHALGTAERLLTRDRGFYRRYFDALPVLDPTA
ncbi:MAG: type II toxin-antitoxin system VapC family toxin [Actinomycetota bacterium]